MAKARLRRGIEIVKLANRIEALKMQEDEEDDSLLLVIDRSSEEEFK
ncbi:putative Calcium/calmodulin-dependent protein kinase [Glarea lozoyensis 74030]|uniref:Putative Calcium/calmodulin-dependent protein kinase n=1 Tax=Glarea lozoyensis (strain ATCC 74030 / MF5533) TaxID=1104152 RepID=H0ECV6_GLAL7|nr:putative Calcium/calmodulin-dependent protein kinase [Glarea lozoyensis 74030]